MKNILIVAILFCCIFGLSNKTKAQDLLIEANHNPATTLIKCEIAEAGFRLNNDHKAIMWVLYRRATKSLSQEEKASLSQVQLNRMMAHFALRYCNALRDNPMPPRSNRRAWAIRGMSRRWIDRHVRQDLLDFVESWMSGNRAEDPCTDRKVNGRPANEAIHWGSWADARRHHWHTRYRIECGTVHNLFFDTENPQ